eukprot:9713067-Alexandrium_andersonii.AAC.1
MGRRFSGPEGSGTPASLSPRDRIPPQGGSHAAQTAEAQEGPPVGLRFARAPTRRLRSRSRAR